MNSKKTIAVIIIAMTLFAGVGGVLIYLHNDSSVARKLLSGSLEVYGNANGDWTINDEDISLLHKIILGEEEKTEFADANCDGVIDELDVTQTQALSDGTAEKVWFIDGIGELMEVHCNPQRIYAFQVQNAELASIMGVGSNVVAGGPPIEYYADFLFPGQKDSMTFVASDWEVLSNLDLDIYLVFSPTQKATAFEKLPGVDVVYFGLYEPDTANLENSSWGQGILKAGYVFNCKERAEGYLDFLLDIRDKIQEVTNTISEENKVSVLASGYSEYLKSEDSKSVTVYLQSDTISQAIALAGGRNVAESLSVWGDSYSTTVDVEQLSEWNIDWITMHYNYYEWTGLSTTNPPGGYTIKDPSKMYETIADVATRPLLANVDPDHLVMLPQEFRNGANGGILCAAYLAKVFYPEQFKDFDPDQYMETYLINWLGIKNYNFDEYNAFLAYGDLTQ
jgi:iron complex transport system substrate-binding protein